MATIRAQVVFQGGTGLAQDRFINTFHFANDAVFATHMTTIRSALATFYNVVPAGGPVVAIGAHIPAFVQRTYTINCYDMTSVAPREPNPYVSSLPAPSGTATSNVPEEVACCLSYKAAPPSSPNRRGRIYIGPLNSLAVNASNATTPVRVSTSFVDVLKAAALALRDTGGLGWSVYSPKLGTYALITSGWVDNACDTQRRRGPKATLRNAWT